MPEALDTLRRLVGDAPGLGPALYRLERRVEALERRGERVIEEAVVWFLEIEKMVSEGAGAAPLAALMREASRMRGQRVGLVLCGGNIDLELFRRWVLGAG